MNYQAIYLSTILILRETSGFAEEQYLQIFVISVSLST